MGIEGQFINARMSDHDALRYEDMTPLQQAKADMDYYRHIGGFGYKQAKKRYERLLRKERKKMKKYYGVVYLKNGDSCVSRECDTEEQVIEALKRVVAREPHKIKATTYMVREDAGEFLFGHPKSRDLIQDRKFMKEIKL